MRVPSPVEDRPTEEYALLRKIVAFAFVGLAVVASVFVILVDVNRFFAANGAVECGAYSDSHGCRADEVLALTTEPTANATPSPLPPRRDGVIFGNSDRSESAWVYMSLVFTASIVANWSLLSYRINERHKPSTSVLRGGGDSHSTNYRRICGTIFACTALALLYDMVVLEKLIRCDRTGQEMAHAVLSGINYVAQGLTRIEILYSTIIIEVFFSSLRNVSRL